MSLKRLHKELRDLTALMSESSFDASFSAGPFVESDMHTWGAAIVGPEGTPYAGGLFQLEVNFPPDYPFKPMKVRFVTPIYHLNIGTNGFLSLNILRSDWSPALTLGKVLISIASVLSQPDPDSPMRPDVAEQYARHRNVFDSTATEWTRRYALGI